LNIKLNIKRKANGMALAFGRRGTYNPATGKMGLDALVFQQASLVSGALSGSPAFQSRMRRPSGRDRNAGVAELDV
jgi:hypothetical protein